MNKVLCEVTLDCIVKTEPVVIKEYGVEVIYGVDVEFQSTKTKMGLINLNYSNSLDLDLHVGDVITVEGELRSIKIDNPGDNADEFSYYRKVYVLARKINVLDEVPSPMQNKVKYYNLLLYSTPKGRKSFKDGTTDIASFVIKYERSNDKSSYLYGSAWHNIANLVVKMKKGTRMTGEGNLQSRESHGCIYNEICFSSITNVEEGDLPDYSKE